MFREEKIFKKKENARNGWILEVDLEYPAELHEAHNSYPLTPQKKEKMSDYQKSLMDDLELTSRTPRSFCLHSRAKKTLSSITETYNFICCRA